jgi:hypothetical protein
MITMGILLKLTIVRFETGNTLMIQNQRVGK